MKGQNVKNVKEISKDYILGFVEGQGSFGFTSSGLYGNKTPTFQIKISINNKALLEGVRDYLKLKNKVYEYCYVGKEKSKRDVQVLLVVRDFKQLKTIIIPFFHNKLRGYKGKQLNEWLENIGKDPEVSEKFKFLYKLHKWGKYT